MVSESNIKDQHLQLIQFYFISLFRFTFIFTSPSRRNIFYIKLLSDSNWNLTCTHVSYRYTHHLKLLHRITVQYGSDIQMIERMREKKDCKHNWKRSSLLVDVVVQIGENAIFFFSESDTGRHCEPMSSKCDSIVVCYLIVANEPNDSFRNANRINYIKVLNRRSQ